ncbi:NADH-quinone oxidoreductase subunit A [Myxococcota bacterium]|nr:NADH-quinone oxidoreductase subunit A [Myxococcota bacterium]
MLAEFTGILVVMFAGLVGALTVLAVSARLAPHRPNRRTSPPSAHSSGWAGPQRVAVRFYRVALVFVIFQVALAFLYPWALVFRDLRELGLVAALAFAGPLGVGFIYAWARRGLGP